VNRSETKVNLLNLSRGEMELFFANLGEKSFRVSQVLQWIYQFGIDDFDAMTNLSKKLRATLKERAEIRVPSIVFEHKSNDGTRKWVLEIDSGNRIETVYIPELNRGTLCVSSQVGCALACTFCSTAQQGFNRNLSTAEIIGQLWVANRALGYKSQDQRIISNVVLMGMGEPLLNFDNVVRAVNIMMDDFGYGLSKRRVTLSTAGVVPAIDRLSAVTDVSLALSLHAATDELRDQLVPLNKKYPIEEVLAACKRYVGNDRRRITIEYVMLDGVNDSLDHANQLVRLLKNLPAKVNLIPFNPFPESNYRRSPKETIDKFRDILMQHDLTTITRKTRGDDINAACGQLVGKVDDKTKRRFKTLTVTQGTL